jgi:hypothetical protein
MHVPAIRNGDSLLYSHHIVDYTMVNAKGQTIYKEVA